ncbi:unnamed protein product, partial [Didymodactylos carnosus]
SIARKQLDYLGYRITPDGIKPTTTNVKKTIDFPTPTSTKAAYSFIQMAQFYRRFIKDFSTIAAPLNMFKNKNVKFEWTPECEQSFNILKQKLSQYPLLAFHDGKSKLKLKINTDASNVGIGGVLQQVTPDGHLQPVQYLSRSLSRREQIYSTVEKQPITLGISPPFDSSKIQDQQRQDQTIKHIHDQLINGKRRLPHTLENGIVHRIMPRYGHTPLKLPFIPQSMIAQLLQAYHDSPT